MTLFILDDGLHLYHNALLSTGIESTRVVRMRNAHFSTFLLSLFTWGSGGCEKNGGVGQGAKGRATLPGPRVSRP